MENRRAQVTIFVIIAIVLVGGIVLYFSLDRETATSLPTEFAGVYDAYLGCVEELSREGVSLLGSQGGYIEVPVFEPGSLFMPFSSQLNFLGQAVPYWMYVSGNNILKEQVPTKDSMEEQLGGYIAERLETCDFSSFEAQGYDVYVSGGEVTVEIEDLQVDVQVQNPVTFHRGEASASVTEHELSIGSRLGSFYGMALSTYNLEKQRAFLEEYALDVMRLYAPVTGTELSCSPKVFIDELIRANITAGLASNMGALKLSGDYYGLSSVERSYFEVDTDFDVTSNVNFLYDPSWPTRIEIHGDRVAQPVGIQEGLGILGFCYVPYHLVYDISFPVMIQFYEDNEFFQFPMAVVISKNQAREALPSIQGTSLDSPICGTRNQPMKIETYDINLNPVESFVQFHCLDSVCSVGQTTNGGEGAMLDAQVPQCVNGFVVARAEGYAEAKKQVSTNTDEVVRLVLAKKFRTMLDLGTVERAMVTFASPGHSATIVYPDSQSIELVEGAYNVTVYAYENSTLKFPATTKQRCVDVPESGVAGFLGAEKEKCFNINLPETEISFAVVGGGTTSEYITEEQLETSEELNINVPLFKTPTSLEELQTNHAAVEGERIYLDFS